MKIKQDYADRSEKLDMKPAQPQTIIPYVPAGQWNLQVFLEHMDIYRAHVQGDK